MAAPTCRKIHPQGRRRLALPGCEGLLLDAAADVFLRRGLHGGTVREIAKRAGLSATMIYYHFGAKEGLACELVRRSQRGLLCDLEAFSRARRPEPLSGEDRDDLAALLGRHLGEGHILGCLLRDPSVQRYPAVVEALDGLRRHVEDGLPGRAGLDLQDLCRWVPSRDAVSRIPFPIDPTPCAAEPLVQMSEAWHERFWWTLSGNDLDQLSQQTS